MKAKIAKARLKKALLLLPLVGVAMFLLTGRGLQTGADQAGKLEGLSCDKVLVLKSKRKLVLIKKGRELASMRVALGGDPKGPKHRQGDERTPEGLYIITHRHKSARFHKSLHVSYPAAKDLKYARKHGIPLNEIGGQIKIHGLPPKLGLLGGVHHLVDWTQGCIAVSNEEMDRLWSAIPDGTPIEIRP